MRTRRSRWWAPAAATAVVVLAVLALALPPLLVGSNVRGWTLTAGFASALGSTAVATATALSLRQSRRQLGRLEEDRTAEDARRLAVLEREQVLEAARAFEVIVTMRGHLARHPLEASLGQVERSAESLNATDAQLALELARAYRELFTALYALPEATLAQLRALVRSRPTVLTPDSIDVVRAEMRRELTRLTRLAATGRPESPVATAAPPGGPPPADGNGGSRQARRLRRARSPRGSAPGSAASTRAG